MTVRITEAEFVNDPRALLATIERGDEVTIDRDGRSPLTIAQRPASNARNIDDCIAAVRNHHRETGYSPVPDKDFANDVRAYVESNQEPAQDLWTD